jgi:hypothetical protein
MSPFRLIALVGLVALFLGAVAVDDAVAGERHKTRGAKHVVKWQPIEVPAMEGEVLASFEEKAIEFNLGGKSFFEGWLHQTVGLVGVNQKTGVGSSHGYCVYTDRDGDKVCARFEGEKVQGDPHWRGTGIIVKGSGKWEGIEGKCTWVSTSVAPGQSYADYEWDIELPRR